MLHNISKSRKVVHFMVGNYWSGDKKVMPSDKATILVCQFDERVEMMNSSLVTITHSPLSCLNAASTTPYRLIILDFTIRSTSRVRSEIIELCKCLKINPLTRKVPLFASIDHWHRGMAAQMKEVGLDFMGIKQLQNRIDPENISNLILNNGISFHIDQVISRLCPFLNYEPINDYWELITCRAWHDRMVLGGKRLHDLCETETHLHCEYFLNPVPKQ